MNKLIIFVLSIVLITSCSKECDQWYEGSNCDIEMRDKFYGVFIGTLTGAGQTQTVSTSITPSSDGVQKFVDGVRKVLDGVKKVLDGVRKVRDSVKKVLDGVGKVSDGVQANVRL